MLERIYDLLPVKYFHVVFTVPVVYERALLIVEKWTRDRALPPQMAGIDVAV